MTESFDPARAVAIVAEYNRVFQTRDLDRLRSFWTEDFIQWHCNIRRDFTADEEYALLRTVLDTAQVSFHRQVLTPLDRGVMDRHVIDIRMNDGARALGVPCVVLFFFRGEKICRSEEYVDGLSVPLMDVLPEPAI